jgi:DNA-binding beta-propeller fold protein YncE
MTGANYFVATINPTTGSVGPRVQFYSDDFFDGYFSVFSDPIIAQVYDPQYIPSAIKIFPNPTNPPISPAPNINCTAAMLLVCGDQISVSIHPSNKYLFVADQTTNEVAILYISAVLQTLVPSGASIPGLASVAFSPDGLLVYAAENNEILVYVFNPHTGLLTARTTITPPAGVTPGVMLPWQ